MGTIDYKSVIEEAKRKGYFPRVDNVREVLGDEGVETAEIFYVMELAALNKWLRDIYNIHVQPQKIFYKKKYKVGKIHITEQSYSGPYNKLFDSYEAAEVFGTEQAVKMI